MSFPALLDTNVLFGAVLNDYVLRLADRGIFRPLWSRDIMEELRENLVRHGVDTVLAAKRIEAMTTYFPDAMIDGYLPLVSDMTCDHKDRHVLAAAVRANAEILVTFNVRDFPPDSTAPFDIEVVHPDDFLLDQLDLHPGATVGVLRKLVRVYDSPRMSAEDLLLVLARNVPRFSSQLATHIEQFGSSHDASSIQDAAPGSGGPVLYSVRKRRMILNSGWEPGSHDGTCTAVHDEVRSSHPFRLVRKNRRVDDSSHVPDAQPAGAAP